MSSYQLIDATIGSPMVSVAMLAYNHQNYITEAIESVLMQTTNFTIQIVIAEDRSTDHTRKIILNYQKLYPQHIKLVLQDINIGSSKNNLSLLENLNGKYIAALEGDDYWTDPLKLQKQVNFLEKYPQFVFCTHRYKVYSEFNSSFEKKLYPLIFKPYNREFKGIRINKTNFFNNWTTQPLTALIRRDILNKILPIFNSLEFSRDFTLFYLLLVQGEGLCMDFMGGVYRKHIGGMHIGATDVLRAKESLLITEELYLLTRDPLFFKHYLAAILTLIKRNSHISMIINSLFKKLSFKDKLKLTKFAVRYLFIKN